MIVWSVLKYLCNVFVIKTVTLADVRAKIALATFMGFV